jgi:hypothetical protein
MNALMNATMQAPRIVFQRIYGVAPTPWKPRRASFFPCAVRYRKMNR